MAGEGNWLNTAYAPGTAPNTGMMFMPEFHFNTLLAAASAAHDLIYSYEIEYVVEFRGSLQ